MVACLIQFAYQAGYEFVFGEVRRTQEQQDIYLKTGKTKTKHSKHLVSLAVDFLVFKDGKYIDGKTKEELELLRPLGEFWEGLGGRWGGRFGVQPKNYDKEIGWDSGHFELS